MGFIGIDVLYYAFRALGVRDKVIFTSKLFSGLNAVNHPSIDFIGYKQIMEFLLLKANHKSKKCSLRQ